MLAAVLPAAGQAAVAHHLNTHHLDLTTTEAAVVIANPGTSAGVVSGRPFGSGAIVQRVMVTPGPGPSHTSVSSFTIYTPRGTLRGTGTSTRTNNPDGTVTIIATRTITGGSGLYRLARGQASVDGVTRQGITTSRWLGTVRF